MLKDDDEILAALDELVDAGRENVIAWVGVMERADRTREQRRRGVAYKDMAFDSGVSIIDAISNNQERLTAAAARFRRVTVRQLHAEGLSTTAIARLFGVSRQRVSSLLGQETADADETAAQHPLSAGD